MQTRASLTSAEQGNMSELALGGPWGCHRNFRALRLLINQFTLNLSVRVCVVQDLVKSESVNGLINDLFSGNFVLMNDQMMN
jgi:hypothetical protein